MLESRHARETDRLLRLIGRYRSLLRDPQDALLRRGIEREIEALETQLKRLEARRQTIPCLIARGGSRGEP